MSAAIARRIRAEALHRGFADMGICDAASAPHNRAALEQFLQQGRHGSMDWMARTAHRRVAPRNLWSDANSVIVLAMNYGPDAPRIPLAQANLLPDAGDISIYARGRDYHDVFKKRLKRLARWMVETFDTEVKVFVDTAPVMEKPLARRAGIGWQGKHTNVVSKKFGSWLFLGEIFTALSLPPSAAHADHCGNCDACVRACPTGAIESYRMDARRCISYLNIEHKGVIAEDLMEGMGQHLYGCDDCLGACPWNKFTRPHDEADFMPAEPLPRPLDILRMDDATFRATFRHSPIKRTGLERMQRNALIALANGYAIRAIIPQEVVTLLEEFASHPTVMLSECARWALMRIGRAGIANGEIQ